MCWDTPRCHSPGNHRVKTVCENDKLRLQCRPKSILAIYSANYGRFLRGKPECDALNTGGPHIGTSEWCQPESGPGAVLKAQRRCHRAVPLPLGLRWAGWCPAGRSARRFMPRDFAECLAPDALRRVSKKCHRKGNCTVTADQATFGDPCLPGMKKQLRVSYTCGEELGGTRAETPLCPPGAVQARQRAAGDKQGSDAWCVLSLQCPNSCWRRWALTLRTPFCSRTICTVMWGGRVALRPCLGEPPLPWPVCIRGTHLWQEPCSPLPAALPMAKGTRWSVPVSERLQRCVLLGAGQSRTHRGVSPRRVVQEGRSVVRGGGRQGQAAGQRGAGQDPVSQPTSPCSCRWLVQRAQVLQAPGRPDDFY